MQNGNLMYRVEELHDEYGEIIRIAPNELSFINASAWHDLYGHHPGRESLPRWGYGDSPNGVDVILTAKDIEHSRFRRLMALVFSEKTLRGIEPIFQKNISLAASVSEAVIRMLLST